MDDAEARLAEASREIVAGVARHASRYLEQAAARVLDAWARVPDRAATDVLVREAAGVATARVVRDLERLLSASAREQGRTPLQVVRTLVLEPTSALRAAGVPPVVRDEFSVRSAPDDDYGLAPVTLADLGDPDLGPLQLAWGIAKTAVLRSERDSGPE